ncbi:MAG TPA: sulfotransferase [Candidatus Paceibacterota bacterium]|nr:sulfotransferase [Verrucomicrobiota bacterium]HSA11743.1 sulfotransferase [Candidatus Paceibacterota bacterium]
MNRNTPVLSYNLEALFAESQKCLIRYDFTGAVEVLRRAHKLAPANDRILVDLGCACAKAYDFAAAHRWFDEAVRISPTPVPALNAIGHAWLEVRNFEAAQACFERILREKQVPLIAFVRLSEIYIRRRRLEEANEITDRALHLYGPDDAVLLARGNAHRQLGQLDLAEKLYHVLVARPNGDLRVRAFAGYELAGLHDHKGEYDKAMTALLDAKALMRRVAAQPLRILKQKQAHLKDMQQSASEQVVQRWRKAGSTDLQPARNLALLCGHARSGTTLLEYVIDAHPGVASAEESTVFHNHAYYPLGQAFSRNATFVSSLDWVPDRTVRHIRAEYFRGIESLLGEPIGERLLLDKNPANTFDVPAIARIFPENKFVAALRDPRDTCLSSFMQAVDVIPDTAAWLTLEGTIEHYSLIMGLWAAWKPCLGDQAIEVRYEDLVENLEPSARRVLDFLGLNWDERVMRFHEHASNKLVRSPTFAQVTKPLYRASVGRWKRYQKYFEPHLPKLAALLRAFGYE